MHERAPLARAPAALLALLSSALYTLAFPPWGLGWLGLIALAPLLIAIAGGSGRRGALLGLLWGTGAIWGIGYWVPVALSTYWGQPPWFGVLSGLLGSIVFMGSYGAGFGACAALIWRRFDRLPRLFLLSATWVAWEVARGRLLTGDPWLLLGYAVGRYPAMVQIADLGAVYLVSFVLALANFSLASLLRSHLSPSPSSSMSWLRGTSETRGIAVAAALLALTLVYGAYRLAPSYPEQPTVRVRVVQGNNDPGSQWREELYGAGLDRYLELSRSQLPPRRPEILIWPESAVTFFLAREPELRRAIGTMLSSLHAELLTGAPPAQARWQ